MSKLAIPDKVRKYVLDRDSYTCQNEYCKGTPHDNLTLHHIISRGASGLGTDPCNLITLCAFCHHDNAAIPKRIYPELRITSTHQLVHRFQAEFYDHDFPEGYIECSHNKLTQKYHEQSQKRNEKETKVEEKEDKSQRK